MSMLQHPFVLWAGECGAGHALGQMDKSEFQSLTSFFFICWSDSLFLRGSTVLLLFFLFIHPCPSVSLFSHPIWAIVRSFPVACRGSQPALEDVQLDSLVLVEIEARNMLETCIFLMRDDGRWNISYLKCVIHEPQPHLHYISNIVPWCYEHSLRVVMCVWKYRNVREVNISWYLRIYSTRVSVVVLALRPVIFRSLRIYSTRSSVVVLALRPVIIPEPTNLFNSCDRGASLIRPVNCSGSYEFICLRHVMVNEIITLNCVYSSVFISAQWIVSPQREDVLPYVVCCCGSEVIVKILV